MEVETSDSIYLRGAIRDVYTGISWANSRIFTEYDVDDSKYILISDNKNENKYDNDNRNDNIMVMIMGIIIIMIIMTSDMNISMILLSH